MANDIKLQEGHPVDENLRPIKVGGKTTALEVSETDVRVNNLHVNGTTKGVTALDETKLPLAGGTMTGNIATSAGFTLDCAGDLLLSAADNDILFTNDATTGGKFVQFIHNTGSANLFYLYAPDHVTDTLAIAVYPNGATTILTNDGDGSAGHLSLDVDGTLTLNSFTGAFIVENNGTEFSAANSAYAGMILGYTRIQNDGTGSSNNVLTINSSAMTVLQTDQGTDFSIQFIVPPSGNVEIQCSFWMHGSSRGAKFSLSTDASYAELGIAHTYDADQTVYIDETDHDITNISFAVTGLTPGTDTTYYLAGLASGSSTFISHGRFRLTGNHYPPIILKAIALPATIVTGE